MDTARPSPVLAAQLTEKGIPMDRQDRNHLWSQIKVLGNVQGSIPQTVTADDLAVMLLEMLRVHSNH
jgi:hypothetical protein